MNNLNAIVGTEASQIESAFRSLQTAVGAKGRLKTDFDALAAAAILFERNYTLGDNIAKMMALGVEKNQRNVAIDFARSNANSSSITMNFADLDMPSVDEIIRMEKGVLKGIISTKINGSGIGFGSAGTRNIANLEVSVDPKLIIEFAEMIRNAA